MQIKNLTLGLSLLLSGSAIAQNRAYTVKPGDTLSGIAGMFNARAQAILRANNLQKHVHLASGSTIVVPNATRFAGNDAPAAEVTERHYKVRNGDCDWTIARKFDTSIHKLHLANPQVEDWDALRNGLTLHIPSSKKLSLSVENTRVASAEPRPSHVKAHVEHKVSSRPFVVSAEDNDWIIAHHLGVSLRSIHELNPGIDWNRLRAGKHILVPGNDGSPGTRVAKRSERPKLKVNRIHTRYAVVNSDAVSIRREAGSHADRITTVDTGTRVVVLDRDGVWYKLRFPRGTEGWVRGDYLNAAHAPVVESHRRRRHIEEADDTRVATRATRRHRSWTPEETVALDSDAKSNPLVQKGIAMLHTPYSYGSSSRSATDCSGFTWQVYRTQGIHLPRTSREQSTVGQPIKTTDLKPGDLLFFGSRQGRGVHHVAMYVGKGKFIHASSGGGKVQFNRLNDEYYHNHYIGARRIVHYTKAKSHASSSHGTHHSAPARTAEADTNPTPLGK